MKRVKNAEDKKSGKSSSNKNKKFMDKLNRKLNKDADCKVYELIIFGALIVFMTAFMSVFIMNIVLNSKQTSLTSKSNKDELAELEEVYDTIKTSYYKEVDSKKMIDEAINGMLSSLNDHHTSYFNKKQTDDFNKLMNGSYEGIGVEISSDKDGNIVILSVFKNSPASEAGLKFGDVFVKVDGKKIEKMTPTDVVALIQGNNKTKVNITIKRNEKEMDFEVEKRNIEIESVESKVYDENNKKIGYLIINNFANNTYDQFRKNLEEIEEKNISGLVIDVRGNSGGYLHSVTNILEMLLPKNTVMYQIADKKTTTKYKTETIESRNYPIAILVDKASASASEILAVSLKESYGAYVVGTSTYGKGTVQTTKLLSSGGMIKYTIQKWLSPKGNWINDVGVSPTNEVELKEEYNQNPIDENDNQLQKALELVSKNN